MRQVCGEHVIMGEGLGAINFGCMLTLNSTATWLWKEAQRQGTFTIDSLADSLCGVYDVALDQAKADISKIIAEWQKLDIIEE